MIHGLPHHSIGFQLQSNMALITLKGIGLHFIDTPTYSWNNRGRKDTHCLLQYTVSGKGILEENGILYSQEAGDAFLVNIPGENHYYLPEDSTHWEVLYLEFSKECLPFLYKIIQSVGCSLHIGTNNYLSDTMFDIYKKALSNELRTLFENTKTAYSFFVDLMEFSISQTTSKITKADIAKHYIDSNYFSQTLNLDEIAEHCGASKFYISHKFQKKYGISPGQYLINLRIQHACRILQQNSSHTLAEIAQMIGFSNDNYFGKVFKRIKGMTANQYRSQNTQYDFVQIVYETPKIVPETN